MDFIKKHYEKVILLGLFVLFVVLMVVVRGIIKSTQEVKASDLKIKLPRPDYQNVDKSADEFKTEKRWNDSNLQWKAPAIDTTRASDLVSMYKLTTCPYCPSKDKKKVLVPLSFFYIENDAERRCPECKHPLEKPLGIDVIAKEEEFYRKDELARLHEEDAKKVEEIAKAFRSEYDAEAKSLEAFAKGLHEVERRRLEKLAEERRREEEKDKDDDGIDDELEQKYGMDSNDKNDIYYDTDGDGFSNICEIKNGTIPNDPKSHPELWWRLRIKSIDQIELAVKFMALIDNGSPDKSTWQLQFNYPDPRRPGKITSQFLMLNGVIGIDNKRYKVVDIKRIITEKKREAGNLDNKAIVDRIDESQVVLEEVDPPAGAAPDRLVMIRDKAAFSNDRRPVLVDTGNPNVKRREQVLRIGDTIQLGLFVSSKDKENGLTAQERKREIRVYKLVKVDIAKMSVTMEDVTAGQDKGKGKPIVIVRDGKIPKDQLPQKKKEKSSSDEGDQGGR